MNVDTVNAEASGLAFRGIIAILFGVAAVFWPGLTIRTFVFLFGGFILASGLISLVAGVSNIYNEGQSFVSRMIIVVLGVVEIGIGIYLLRHPEVAFTTLILLVGFALILRGLFDIVAGLFEARGAMHRTVMIVGGLLAGIAGVVLLFQPASGGIAFVWILGVYALISGPLLIALSMDIRNHAEDLVEGAASATRSKRRA